MSQDEAGALDESDALTGAAARSLATVFTRRALEAASIEPLTSASFGLANELFRLADTLDPDQPEVLRGHLAVAALSEDAALRSQLLERLARLEPEDERIRLARINDVLSRYGNAEELIAAYLVILKDANIRKLGGPVASRLATGLAVLYERQGDSASYAQWISKASALDQSNKEAAALAAGYFQQHVDNPFGQAELLVNLLLADPMDVSTQAALGRLLLEHGAYAGAIRMYELTVNTYGSLQRYPSANLLADLAIAEWGAGRPGAAMQRIKNFQQVLDESLQLRAWREDPELGPTERAALTAVLPATLAVVHLALLESQDQAAAAAALAKLQESITTSLATNTEIPPEERQASLLTQAWLESWFGRDPAAIQAYLDLAAGDSPVNDVARSRFEGWIAFRANDLAKAEAVLSPIAERDLPAMAALALTRAAQSRDAEAAALFAAIATRDPGSVMGVWARQHALALSPTILSPSRAVAQMNDLIASIPGGIDRIPTDRQFGISLRVDPVRPLCRAYEPLLVRLVITNHTGLDIGISAEGPLRPNVILESEIAAPSQPRITKGPPIVVDIGRRLRLGPRQKLEVVIDLRHYGLGDFLNAAGTGGASVQFRGILNPFPITQNVIEAGPLGYVTRSHELRIDGVRVTPEWLVGMTAALHADESMALSDLGLLVHAIHAHTLATAPNTTPEFTSAAAGAMAALLEKFPAFDSVVQSWILSAVPRPSEPLKPLLELAAASEAPLVQITYLTNHLEGPSDPMLEKAAAGADPQASQIAGFIALMIEQQEAAQAQGSQQQDAAAQGQGGGQ